MQKTAMGNSLLITSPAPLALWCRWMEPWAEQTVSALLPKVSCRCSHMMKKKPGHTAHAHQNGYLVRSMISKTVLLTGNNHARPHLWGSNNRDVQLNPDFPTLQLTSVVWYSRWTCARECFSEMFLSFISCLVMRMKSPTRTCASIQKVLFENLVPRQQTFPWGGINYIGNLAPSAHADQCWQHPDCEHSPFCHVSNTQALGAEHWRGFFLTVLYLTVKEVDQVITEWHRPTLTLLDRWEDDV